jgi:hypothetical protein
MDERGPVREAIVLARALSAADVAATNGTISVG